MKVLAGLLEHRGGEPVATKVYVADDWWSRLRGQIGRPPLGPGEALWILPCNQVHTHFMGAPLGVAFLDADLLVMRVIAAMPPWQISPLVRGARSVLEFSAQAMPMLTPGQHLHWRR